MSKAAPKDITEQLSVILSHIASRNADMKNTNSPFYSTAPPAIDLSAYMRRMHDYMYCSLEAYVLASVLITRLEETSKQSIICPGSVHRLLLTASVVAAKMNDDVFLDNKHYADVGGISLTEMNRLELALLDTLNYQVFVSPDQYDTCLASMHSLHAMITNTASAAVINSAQRLRRSSSVVGMVVDDVSAMAVARHSPAEVAIATRRASMVSSTPLEEFAFADNGAPHQRRGSVVNAL